MGGRVDCLFSIYLSTYLARSWSLLSHSQREEWVGGWVGYLPGQVLREEWVGGWVGYLPGQVLESAVAFTERGI